jgi:hypothetical protein
MVLLKAGLTQYYEADEQIVNNMTLFNFRNAKPCLQQYLQRCA